MNTSELGISFIESFEKFSPTIYTDQGGKPTIGFGHLVEPTESFPDPITEDTANAIMQADLCTAEDCINSNVTVTLSQNQFDALVSFTFNVGIGNFQNSTLLKLLNSDNIEACSQQFLRWDHVNGVESAGLLARRKAEENIFSNGVYQNHN